jgi:hypothetical protein
MELPGADELLARVADYLAEGKSAEDQVASEMLRHCRSLRLWDTGYTQEYGGEVRHGLGAEFVGSRWLCEALDQESGATWAIVRAMGNCLPSNYYVWTLESRYDPTMKQLRPDMRERQGQVKAYKVQGLTNYQIAMRLNCSESTVKRDVRALKDRGELR